MASHAFRQMPDNVEGELRETFRLAVWSVLENLSLLRNEHGLPADELEDEDDDQLNGELALA